MGPTCKARKAQHEHAAVSAQITVASCNHSSHGNVKGGSDRCTLLKQADISSPQHAAQPSKAVAVPCTDIIVDPLVPSPSQPSLCCSVYNRPQAQGYVYCFGDLDGRPSPTGLLSKNYNWTFTREKEQGMLAPGAAPAAV